MREHHVGDKVSVRRALAVVIAAAVAWTGAIVLAEQRPTTTETVQVQRPEQAPQVASLHDPNERFEIVSIRESIPDRTAPLGPPQINPGRIVLNNNSLYTLIVWAYGLECLNADGHRLVSGGPEWVRTDQWVIQALIPEAAGLQVPAGMLIPSPGRSPISDPKLQRMLQNLLAERFKLVLRRETKEVPVYELIVAKGGPKLQHPKDVPCTPDKPRAPLKPGEKPQCLMAGHRSIADFSALITQLFDRPVIDKTGITGMFDIRLIWAFEPPPGRPPAPGTVPADPTGPSIFTALQEQLGLKLESAKGPVEVLVIDSVQRPSEN